MTQPTPSYQFPPSGRPRLTALGELDAAIAADTIRKLDRLTAEGWDAQDVFERVREWWLDRVDAAVDLGVCEWNWRRAA